MNLSKDNFYLSSSCVTEKKISDAVLRLARAGIRNIELSGGTKFYNGIESDLLNLKERFRINFLIHNYFPPPEEDFFVNLGATDKSEKTKLFKHIKRAIILAQSLGLDMYSVHSGYSIDILPIVKGLPLPADTKDKGVAIAALYANLEYIGERMFNGSFKFAVENKETFVRAKDCSLLCNPDEIFEYLNYCKGKTSMGLLLDIGHLNVSSFMLGFDKFRLVEELFNNHSNKIFEIHLSENNGQGDSHDMVGADSWQIEILKKYSPLIKNIPIVFEWRQFLLDDTVERYNTLVSALCDRT